MTSKTEVPVDLYIAAYGNTAAAQQDWGDIKQMTKDKLIDVEGLAFLGRDKDGKLEIKDNAHDVRKGVGVGAVAGAVVGVIFPPAILGSAIVGAVVGGGITGLRDRKKKQDIRDDVEEVMPANSSAIVVLFEQKWADEVESVLSGADVFTKHEVDNESVDALKAAVR